MNLTCSLCGHQYEADEFRNLEFLSGGRFEKKTADGSVAGQGYEEFRRCSECSGNVRHLVSVYDESEPVTLRSEDLAEDAVEQQEAGT